MRSKDQYEKSMRFTDQSSKPLEIEDRINVTMVIK